MKRRPKVEPYAVPRWMAPALQVLRPKKRLTVSAWAEANRILPDTNAVAGPWRNALTPYLIEIMDAFSDDTTEQIVFVKPTQVGGTSAMENALGSAIDQDPGPAMMVYPSDQLAKRTVESKLEPMFKSCPALAAKYRAHESEDLAQRFDGMTVYLTGANSPADLSSTPIRYLFLDEVDKYPGSTKKESDPVSLAVERTKSYRLNRKIFMASTPTLKTGLIWRAKEAAEAEKHYFVPCPHCGAFIELKFAQLKWPSKEEEPDMIQRARRARYVCQECGCILTDRDKPAMLRAGRWQFIRRDSETPRSVAFWMNTLYSPFTTFEEVVREFLKVKDDPEMLHNFVNSWLAEPWEDTKLKTSADLVLERQTETPAWQLPPWTKLLTGGAPGIDTMQAIMLKLLRQTDPFGESIMVQPRFVIVPVGYGFKMAQILESPQIDVEGIGSHTANALYQYRNRLQVVEEGTINTLAKGEDLPWFMAGDPATGRSIQVDYLNGMKTPSIRRSQPAGRLGYVWDIWMDWGVSAVDWRGIAKNPGVQ